MRRAVIVWTAILAASCLSPLPVSAAGVDPALLALTDCPDEPGCPALILLDEMEVNNQSGRAEMSYRRVVKVFTAPGADRWATVTLTALAGSFTIRNFKGRTLLPDGRHVDLDQDNIQVKTVFRSNDTRVLQKTALFPGVVPGAAIDYSYDVISDKLGDFVRFEWDIQAEAPVLRSDLVLKHGGIRFAWMKFGMEKVPVAEEHPFPNVYKFHATNVPAIPQEPFGPSPDVWRARMQFHHPSIVPLWLTFYGGGLGRDLNVFVQKNRLVAAKVRALRSEGDSTAQTIGKVYRFVQESIGPAVQEDGGAGGGPALKEPAADDVLALGSGTDAQRTMLFVSLLKEAGIPSALVAVASRDHATLDLTRPDGSQFDALAAAVREGNHWSFYDPATRHCPFGMVTPLDENVVPNAIVVMPGRGLSNTVMIPVSPASRNLLTRDLQVTLRPDGSGLVDAVDEGDGLVDLDHRRRYEALTESDRRRALEEWLRPTLPLARLETATFENLESFTGKARIRYRFVVPDLTVASGSALVINPSMLHGGQAAPFTAETRRTPVDFGHSQKTLERIAFSIPEGYTARSAPAPAVLRDGPLSLTTTCTVLENEIVFSRRLEIDAAIWRAQDYPRLKAFFDKVRDADRQSLILAREDKGGT